jgi:BMFP domain-containing protein YqiC
MSDKTWDEIQREMIVRARKDAIRLRQRADELESEADNFEAILDAKEDAKKEQPHE